MNTKLCFSILPLFLAAIFACVSRGDETPAGARYKNPNLPLAERVDDLVSRMTLEEKVSQLGHTAEAIPRLGVPEYDWWNEGLHGVARAGTATVFPQAIGMAATFDAPLLNHIAAATGSEFRAKYYAARHPDGSSDWFRGLTVWSPNINIFRDPRWGRGQETYGEDPFLSSRLGVAFVTGLQGDDPKYLRVVSTPKHFAVHSGPESTRHSVDVEVSRHDLEDTYLPAFRATVTEGKAESVMCAYNSVNGQPACANDVLLGQHLRQDWQFRGYVVSDCGAVADIFEGHHYTQTMPEAVRAALKAGTDLICGVPVEERVRKEREAILAAVRQGILSEDDVTRAVRRLFTARFRLGMFDPPAMVPYAKTTPAANDSLAHRQLALKAARESIVLLRNQGSFLPLKKTYRKIAVIGPNADSLDALVGNYNGTPSRPVTVLAGIRRSFPHSEVTYVEGTGLIGPPLDPVPAAALYTDDSRGTHGMHAEYFSNTNLEGTPVLVRTDATVNFAWGFSGVSGKLRKNYSVRWTGVLVPEETGDYLIGFTGQDGYRVWLDGNLIVEDWTSHRPSSTQTKPLHLEKGRAYRIRIEYFQTIRGAEARLVWSNPGREEQKAVDAAGNADLLVLALGLSARLEGEQMNVHAEGFSGGDRTTLDLPGPQEDLLKRLVAQGKPTILVLMNGSALAVNWANENVPAILEAWYPGGEGGTAVAEAIRGDFSPAGRLPVTFYKSADQLPAFEDYSMAKRTYRYFDGEPLYPFGYGLSYTAFAYKNVKADRENVAAGESLTIRAEVTNTGAMAGEEVVELYLTHEGIAGAPRRALEGVERFALRRGEQRTVSFTLRDRELSLVDPSGKRRIMPGKVDVWVGGGQPLALPALPKASGGGTSFTITGEATLPD